MPPRLAVTSNDSSEIKIRTTLPRIRTKIVDGKHCISLILPSVVMRPNDILTQISRTVTLHGKTTHVAFPADAAQLLLLFSTHRDSRLPSIFPSYVVPSSTRIPSPASAAFRLPVACGLWLRDDGVCTVAGEAKQPFGRSHEYNSIRPR